jgi:hypothetical protein
MDVDSKLFKQESPFITQGDIMTQISFRAEINEYTNRVLGVIKEKYGFQNKSEALDYFADIYGEDFVDKEIKESIIKEMKAAMIEHKKKYPNRTMTLEELHALTRPKNVQIRSKR